MSDFYASPPDRVQTALHAVGSEYATPILIGELELCGFSICTPRFTFEEINITFTSHFKSSVTTFLEITRIATSVGSSIKSAVDHKCSKIHGLDIVRPRICEACWWLDRLFETCKKGFRYYGLGRVQVHRCRFSSRW
jgi:hypothetical protein